MLKKYVYIYIYIRRPFGTKGHQACAQTNFANIKILYVLFCLFGIHFNVILLYLALSVKDLLTVWYSIRGFSPRPVAQKVWGGG